MDAEFHTTALRVNRGDCLTAVTLFAQAITERTSYRVDIDKRPDDSRSEAASAILFAEEAPVVDLVLSWRRRGTVGVVLDDDTWVIEDESPAEDGSALQSPVRFYERELSVLAHDPQVAALLLEATDGSRVPEEAAEAGTPACLIV